MKSPGRYRLPDGAEPLDFGGMPFPDLVRRCGLGAARRFANFFLSKSSSSENQTEMARAIVQFCAWADRRGFSLYELGPITVSIYVEMLRVRLTAPRLKQHVIAVGILFDWLIAVGFLLQNPTPSLDEVEATRERGLPAAQASWLDRDVIDVAAFR
jgi:hypothetical protein